MDPLFPADGDATSHTLDDGQLGFSANQGQLLSSDLFARDANRDLILDSILSRTDGDWGTSPHVSYEPDMGHNSAPSSQHNVVANTLSQPPTNEPPTMDYGHYPPSGFRNFPVSQEADRQGGYPATQRSGQPIIDYIGLTVGPPHISSNTYTFGTRLPAAPTNSHIQPMRSAQPTTASETASDILGTQSLGGHRRATTSTTSSVSSRLSASKRAVYGVDVPKQSRKGSVKGSRSFAVPVAGASDDEGDDDDIDEVEAAALKTLEYFKIHHPILYDVFQRLIKVAHVKEWDLPFRAVTLDEALEWYRTALTWHLEDGGRAVPATSLDLPPIIFDIAQRSQGWAHTGDLKKGSDVLQRPKNPPKKYREYYGFTGGNRLPCWQIMRNKLLAFQFADLDALSFAHTYFLGVLAQPFGNTCFIDFICDLIAGKTRINPKSRPWTLRFFRDGKVSRNVIAYGILVIYHLSRQHASGNRQSIPTFSRDEYATTIVIIQNVVESFKDDPRFIRLLEMLYDAMAQGNA